MATIRAPLALLGASLLTLTACDKLAGDDADFARAALERNDQLSIMAYDKNAKTFTVKVRDSGEIQVVRADEVIGTVPAAQKAAMAKPAAAAAPAPAPAAAENNEPADKVAASGEEARPAPGSEKPPGASDAATASNNAPSGTGFIKDSSGKVTQFGNGAGASAAAPAGAATEHGASGGKTLASGP